MVRRALRLRCPQCGSRRTFLRGWFHTYPRCRTCGLRWRRGKVGFELGAASINAVITLGAIVVGMVIGIAITYPDVAVVPLIVVLGAVALVVPIIMFPFTYTVWLACELAMERPSENELADAAAHAGAGANA